MSNIDTKNSKFNLGCIAEELFTELTPEQTEAIEGGGSFAEGLSFTNFQHTETEFFVPQGGSISLETSTMSDKGYNYFAASIYNTDTHKENTKTVDIGSDTTTWTDVNGGNYIILFEDPDDDLISGSVVVNYT